MTKKNALAHATLAAWVRDWWEEGKKRFGEYSPEMDSAVAELMLASKVPPTMENRRRWNAAFARFSAFVDSLEQGNGKGN